MTIDAKLSPLPGEENPEGGFSGTDDHQLRDSETLSAVRMVAPLDGERAAYFRAISRTLAECPLVEAVVRLGVTAGTIRFARIAVGGVAPVPLRLERVENALRALHSYDEFDVAIKDLKQP